MSVFRVAQDQTADIQTLFGVSRRRVDLSAFFFFFFLNWDFGSNLFNSASKQMKGEILKNDLLVFGGAAAHILMEKPTCVLQRANVQRLKDFLEN